VAAYYNEIDPYAAEWLRGLIVMGLIPWGDVDERSIVDVQPDDLRGYTQCHFFAGVGGWSYALHLAGWPEDRAVWTGSCPCQPFSAAGKQKGEKDERHLWPEFHRLIAECRPPVVFGEQVASKLGREWLAGVFADLEGVGYEMGAADLPASAVGAPHIRQRLWFVAQCGDDAVAESEGVTHEPSGEIDAGACQEVWPRHDGAGVPTQMEDVADGFGRSDPSFEGVGAPHIRQRLWWGADADARGLGACGMEAGDTVVEAIEGRPGSRGPCRLGDAQRSRLEGHTGHEPEGHEPGRLNADPAGPTSPAGGDSWSDYIWVPCADGKARRLEPSIEPLVDGAAFKLGSGSPFEGKSRVGMLRAYGNCIVPQVAAEFIGAFIDAANT
jgi:DNA (cytosine-5)-methyltransferase 1